MRLAHPRPKLLAPRQPRLVAATGLVHPRAEVVGAHPAGIQAREKRQEVAHVVLLLGRRGRRVRGRQRVQEGPGRAAQGLDVGRAVGGDWQRRGAGGAGRGGASGGGRGGLLGQGFPGCDGGAEAASVFVFVDSISINYILPT